MGFSLMMEMMAVTGPPRHGKTHYMGLNLELFWQTGHNMSLVFGQIKSDCFTGVFLGTDDGIPPCNCNKNRIFPGTGDR